MSTRSTSNSSRTSKPPSLRMLHSLAICTLGISYVARKMVVFVIRAIGVIPSQQSNINLTFPQILEPLLQRLTSLMLIALNFYRQINFSNHKTRASFFEQASESQILRSFKSKRQRLFSTNRKYNELYNHNSTTNRD